MPKLFSRSFIFILLMGLLLNQVSCKKVEEANEVNRVITFFDLATYFQNIVDDYTTKEYIVNKKVAFGNKNEQKKNLEINWQSEFQSFINADINRVAWVDKFKADTFTMNEGYSVTYQSLDNSIPIKNIEILFKEDESVEEIKINVERQSLLYKSKQALTFKPEKSYTVEGWQRTMMLSKTEFNVYGDIVTEQ